MKKLALEEIKKIDLGIISDIDRVCRDNNLKYTIIGGTLIGAIRHKGFIPWDDDIDIALKREDYEKFIKIYQKSKGPNYEILSNSINKNYTYPMTKVTDIRTIMIEKNTKQVDNLGINVDIFPIDYIDSKFINIKLFRMKFYIKALNYCNIDNKTIKENLCKKVLKRILFINNAKYYLNKINKLSQKENKSENTDLAGVLIGRGKKDIFPRYIFNDYIDLKFESLELMSIKHYDIFLKHRFGDYMQLPPIKEQIPEHIENAYWVK